MKKLILLLSATFILFASCSKDEETKHELRVTNNFMLGIDISVGSNDYGVVNTGSTTAYKEISEGSHAIIGMLNDTLQILQGSISIQGKGQHKWTMAISSLGGATLTED